LPPSLNSSGGNSEFAWYSIAAILLISIIQVHAHAHAHAPETEQCKLFPGSQWEFQRWRKLDCLAFASACLIALGLLGVFFFLLTLGRK
jgi:hypothetical protein